MRIDGGRLVSRRFARAAQRSGIWVRLVRWRWDRECWLRPWRALDELRAAHGCGQQKETRPKKPGQAGTLACQSAGMESSVGQLQYISHACYSWILCPAGRLLSVFSPDDQANSKRSVRWRGRSQCRWWKRTGRHSCWVLGLRVGPRSSLPPASLMSYVQT